MCSLVSQGRRKPAFSLIPCSQYDLVYGSALRCYIGLLRERTLVDTLKLQLNSVNVHNFRILSLQPHNKDGGVFVYFEYMKDESGQELSDIVSQATSAISNSDNSSTWLGRGEGCVWLVKGTPWREDMDRFASPVLKVMFDGTDMNEESLYQTFRPFGRIRDISSPSPIPASSMRSSSIVYERVKSAVAARNAMYGANVGSNASKTRLRVDYQRQLQAHVIRDWVSSHPKIMFPLVIFLLGALTYTIFDPIRSLMIQGKLLNWFDYRETKLFKWWRTYTSEYRSSLSIGGSSMLKSEVWKDRKDAENSLKAYLADMPSTIAFIYGPQGSGKTRMVQSVLHETGRDILVIDCDLLNHATSDAQLVGALATQIGYKPVFTFLNSLNTLIDLASVGLIGQKSGLSNSLPDQIQQILHVTTTALRGVASKHRAQIERHIKQQEEESKAKLERAKLHAKLRNGTWHDGRIDCVAGNGVMSELGFGDEPLDSEGAELEILEKSHENAPKEPLPHYQKQTDIEAVGALPTVVIKNYSSKVGPTRDDVLNILAQWVANLVETQIAHVVIISDNRENAKRAAKALPTKPLHTIPLSDADTKSSLSFVQQKLNDAGLEMEFTPGQTSYIERLGGRASDLESLIHKVRGGQQVQDAVEEIIDRGMSELRKNAFGEDAESGKGLPWTRQQAWKVVKSLSKQPEVPYHTVLLDAPFKGDETALREMEHAEVLSIGTLDGRPSTIKPGRPILQSVFARLASDPIFAANEDIVSNNELIASYEKTIKDHEAELININQIISAEPSSWLFSRGSHGLKLRARHLTSKIYALQKKIETMDKENKELKAILAKGDKKR
ncbi:hypothetical protein AMATHDRAFT_77324 [Amanita thiersii Skay4041]|uniref:Mitochondrial escape protein 2 n=1 Tax=Amanita thiersii Skay4041 TaxID=703135 RepID=A0A2A9N9D0_9AGAR|nr:hypothetical protein AMATHDRAFT_77324 [Amanita thiersii Skay4041]